MALISLGEALGGLGLFVLGMKSLSDGLQRLVGDRLRITLERITRRRVAAALVGTSLAALFQSGSAAAILVISFVNAGLISLYQALSILLGTGIGTTLSIQLIAFRVAPFALPAVFVGVFLRFFGRRRRRVYLGELLLGIGLVFFGLQVMESGFTSLGHSALFAELPKTFLATKIVALLAGAFLCFVIQSGSAAIGVIMAMTVSGLIGPDIGMTMVIGEGIGAACITGIASLNGTGEAKRSALIYLLINVFAVALVLLFFPLFRSAVVWLSGIMAGLPLEGVGIDPAKRLPAARLLANAHTLFSVGSVTLFLPLIGFFTRSASSIVAKNERLDDFEPRSRFIDFRVVNTPPLAILQARREMLRMAAIAGSMFDDVAGQFHRYDAKRTLRVRAKEDALDALYRDISQFLVQLSRQQLSPEVSLEIPILLEVTKHLEHLGDQNLAVLNYLTRKKEEKIIFSSPAMTELRGIAAQVAEMVRHAGACLEKGNGIDLADAWTLKNAIDEQREAMNANHIKRMTSGKCTVMAGLVYGDLLSAFGRIAEYSFGIIKIRKELA